MNDVDDGVFVPTQKKSGRVKVYVQGNSFASLQEARDYVSSLPEI